MSCDSQYAAAQGSGTEILVTTYWAPLPRSDAFAERIVKGGCGCRGEPLTTTHPITTARASLRSRRLQSIPFKTIRALCASSSNYR